MSRSMINNHCSGFLMQQGWTPLYIAAERNYSDIIPVLVEKGAHIDIRDKVWLSGNYNDIHVYPIDTDCCCT